MKICNYHYAISSPIIIFFAVIGFILLSLMSRVLSTDTDGAKQHKRQQHQTQYKIKTLPSRHPHHSFIHSPYSKAQYSTVTYRPIWNSIFPCWLFVRACPFPIPRECVPVLVGPPPFPFCGPGHLVCAVRFPFARGFCPFLAP